MTYDRIRWWTWRERFLSCQPEALPKQPHENQERRRVEEEIPIHEQKREKNSHSIDISPPISERHEDHVMDSVAKIVDKATYIMYPRT